MVTTKKQLHTENVTLSQEKLQLKKEKRHLIQDNAKLREEKAQLIQEKTQIRLSLEDYKKQADMYENERRRSQEVNSQIKSSNQVYI